MTREEYRKKLIEVGYAEAFVITNFPSVLLHVASDLFLKGDLDSKIAKETRRRLTQLSNLGWTDD